MSKYIDTTNFVMNRAYLRDGDYFVTGEALVLAVLLHSKGRGRKGEDMREVQRIMKDRNI